MNFTERSNKARNALLIFLLAGCPLMATDPSTKPRPISYRDSDDIPHIYVLSGFTTELRLDPSEVIVQRQLGSDYFIVDFLGREANVKPAGTEAGKRTNLQLLCASGNIYSFIVEDVSKRPDIHADLKVIVKNADKEAQAAMLAPPVLFTKDQVDNLVQPLRQQVALTTEQLKREEKDKQEQISAAVQNEASSIKHRYQWKHDKAAETLGVTDIWDDGKFFKLAAKPQEAAALYEIKDGHESLIQYTYDNGIYTVPKVLDEGCLRVGRTTLKFHRNQS